MPRRADIHRILVIGSGPIVIGQAAEFDYSGTQATKALREEKYEVILINSNPATIMTDPEFATRTYIEPLNAASVTKVIEREKPDALLPTLGGGTALDLARPKENVRTHGFTPEERAGFQRFLDAGFVDTFRHTHPDQPGQYTWWRQFGGARERNIGWRIDYMLISAALLPSLVSAQICSEVSGSDHCPVAIELNQ